MQEQQFTCFELFALPTRTSDFPGVLLSTISCFPENNVLQLLLYTPQDNSVMAWVFLTEHEKRVGMVRKEYVEKARQMLPLKNSNEDLTTVFPHLIKTDNMLKYMGPSALRQDGSLKPWNLRKNGGSTNEEQEWLQFKRNGVCPKNFALGLPSWERLDPQKKKEFMLSDEEDYKRFVADIESSTCRAIGQNGKSGPPLADYSQLVAVGGMVSLPALTALRNGISADASTTAATSALQQLGGHQAEAHKMLMDNKREQIKFDRIAEGGSLATIHEAAGTRLVAPAIVFSEMSERWRALRVLNEVEEISSRVEDGRSSDDRVWPPVQVTQLFEEVLGTQKQMEELLSPQKIQWRYKHDLTQGGDSEIPYEPRPVHHVLTKLPLRTGSLVLSLTAKLLFKLWKECESSELPLPLVIHRLALVERRTKKWRVVREGKLRGLDLAEDIDSFPGFSVERDGEDVIRDLVLTSSEESRFDVFPYNPTRIVLEETDDLGAEGGAVTGGGHFMLKDIYLDLSDEEGQRLKGSYAHIHQSIEDRIHYQKGTVAAGAAARRREQQSLPEEDEGKRPRRHASGLLESVLETQRVLDSPYSLEDAISQISDEQYRATAEGVFLPSTSETTPEQTARGEEPALDEERVAKIKELGERLAFHLRGQVFVLSGVVEIRASDWALLSKGLRQEIQKNFLLGDRDEKRLFVKGFDEAQVYAALRDGRVLSGNEDTTPQQEEAVLSVYLNDRYFRQDRSPDVQAMAALALVRLNCLNKENYAEMKKAWPSLGTTVNEEDYEEDYEEDDEVNYEGAGRAAPAAQEGVEPWHRSCLSDEKSLPGWVGDIFPLSSSKNPPRDLPAVSAKVSAEVQVGGNANSVSVLSIYTKAWRRSGRFEVGRHYFMVKWGLMSTTSPRCPRQTDENCSTSAAVEEKMNPRGRLPPVDGMLDPRRAYRQNELDPVFLSPDDPKARPQTAMVGGVQFLKCANEGDVCRCPARTPSRVVFLRGSEVVGNIRATPFSRDASVNEPSEQELSALPLQLSCEPETFGENDVVATGSAETHTTVGECFCDASAVDVLLPLKPELQIKASFFLEENRSLDGGATFGDFDGRLTEQGVKHLREQLSSRGAEDSATLTEGHQAQTIRYRPSNKSFHEGETVLVLERLWERRRLERGEGDGDGFVGFVKDCSFQQRDESDELSGNGSPTSFAAPSFRLNRRSSTTIEICAVQLASVADDSPTSEREFPAYDLVSPRMNFKLWAVKEETNKVRSVARIEKIHVDSMEMEIHYLLEATGEKKKKRFRLWENIRSLFQPLVDGDFLERLYRRFNDEEVPIRDHVPLLSTPLAEAWGEIWRNQSSSLGHDTRVARLAYPYGRDVGGIAVSGGGCDVGGGSGLPALHVPLSKILQITESEAKEFFSIVPRFLGNAEKEHYENRRRAIDARAALAFWRETRGEIHSENERGELACALSGILGTPVALSDMLLDFLEQKQRNAKKWSLKFFEFEARKGRIFKAHKSDPAGFESAINLTQKGREELLRLVSERRVPEEARVPMERDPRRARTILVESALAVWGTHGLPTTQGRNPWSVGENLRQLKDESVLENLLALRRPLSTLCFLSPTHPVFEGFSGRNFTSFKDVTSGIAQDKKGNAQANKERASHYILGRRLVSEMLLQVWLEKKDGRILSPLVLAKRALKWWVDIIGFIGPYAPSPGAQEFRSALAQILGVADEGQIGAFLDIVLKTKEFGAACKEKHPMPEKLHPDFVVVRGPPPSPERVEGGRSIVVAQVVLDWWMASPKPQSLPFVNDDSDHFRIYVALAKVLKISTLRAEALMDMVYSELENFVDAKEGMLKRLFGKIANPSIQLAEIAIKKWRGEPQLQQDVEEIERPRKVLSAIFSKFGNNDEHVFVHASIGRASSLWRKAVNLRGAAQSDAERVAILAHCTFDQMLREKSSEVQKLGKDEKDSIKDAGQELDRIFRLPDGSGLPRLPFISEILGIPLDGAETLRTKMMKEPGDFFVGYHLKHCPKGVQNYNTFWVFYAAIRAWVFVGPGAKPQLYEKIKDLRNEITGAVMTTTQGGGSGEASSSAIGVLAADHREPIPETRTHSNTEPHSAEMNSNPRPAHAFADVLDRMLHYMTTPTTDRAEAVAAVRRSVLSLSDLNFSRGKGNGLLDGTGTAFSSSNFASQGWMQQEISSHLDPSRFLIEGDFITKLELVFPIHSVEHSDLQTKFPFSQEALKHLVKNNHFGSSDSDVFARKKPSSLQKLRDDLDVGWHADRFKQDGGGKSSPSVPDKNENPSTGIVAGPTELAGTYNFWNRRRLVYRSSAVTAGKRRMGCGRREVGVRKMFLMSLGIAIGTIIAVHWDVEHSDLTVS